MNDKCTVVINSCDKYEDAWYPFFELIKKNWKDCKYPFVLNTESKKYRHNGIALETINLGLGETNHWGKRLINVLKKLETKYVILMLEDFFLLGPVNQNEIERCIQWMNEDNEIVAIYFKKIMGYEVNQKEEYILMEDNKRYKLNLQAGLWDREKLISILDDKDNPWDFEEIGYKRLINTRHKFYCSSIGSHYDTENNVFKYLVARDFGYGIWKGKWLWNNNKLLKSNGITIGKLKMDRMTKFQYLIWKFKRKINQLLSKKKQF